MHPEIHRLLSEDRQRELHGQAAEERLARQAGPRRLYRPDLLTTVLVFIAGLAAGQVPHLF